MASKEVPIAIVGMAVRLPGVESCDDFWKLLIEGQNTFGEFPENRASDVRHILSAFQSSLLNESNPFFKGSYFKSVDKFDADLFSITPTEALFIEPEQRIFLELVWELLEDAGYACKVKGTKTGVYVGNNVSKYKYILIENHPSVSQGNHSPFISSRVSCTLDLSGPAMMVATGCSSSLMAIHLACQGLLSNDCEMAIAGGITLDLLPLSLKTDIWNQIGVTRPNVKHRASDTDCKRIGKGEGCGVVLLKPLNKAVSDGDFVYAVLEASTTNQDGHSNAPQPIAQANLLCQAWNLAKISPNVIGYFEAHGIGTELNDPTEISAITTAFENLGIKSCNKIPVSSVRTNIGHLADGGAGILALIKMVLCLIKGKIPPSMNLSKSNPAINWDAAPVYVNSMLLDWKPNANKPRYGGVSAFGLQGTNVHIVVREFIYVSLPKVYLPTTMTNEVQILAMAANSQQSLYTFLCKLKHYLNCLPDKDMYVLRNICYTVNTSREQNKFSYKAIVYAPDMEKMMRLLEKLIDTHFDLENLAEKDVKMCHGNSGFTAFYRYSSVNLESTNTVQQYCDAIAPFLKGEAVNWLQFYHNHLDLKRVPLVPTYAFDRKRFWPEANQPISMNFLQLDRQVSYSNKELSDNKKASTQCKTDIDVMDLQNGNNFGKIKSNTIQNTVSQPTSYGNLSTVQQRILVMQETAPDLTAYVETIAHYTTNKVNTTAVFKNLLERHPILASRIDQNGKSLNLTIKQEIVNCNIDLEFINRFEDAGAYLTNSIPVMKVISSPLAIFRLLKVEDKLIIAMHIHHIIADDITFSNIACDLCNIMNDTAKEQYPFSHKAANENESVYLKSPQMDLDKDFWSQVFLTLPPEVNLTILPKGECIWNNTVAYKAKHISKVIPTNIIKEISRFCESLEITEFHFYMACTALVLQRYLGAHELVLAVPVSTRTDLYPIVDGLFVNTVLFRLSIDFDSSVKGYIQAVAKSWLQVLVHSQYPFDKVVNAIWKKHGKGFSSFCAVMFNNSIQNRLSKNYVHVISKHAKMPLSINVVHNNHSDTTKLMCEWASEIIDDGIIERLVDGIFEIFQKVLNNSNNKINDIQVLSCSECNVLKSFSRPYQDYEGLSINETFKKHVKNHPNSVAIVYKDKTITYLQLEAMALLIASRLHQLVDQTTLKQKPVILVSEKSEYAIASILGVWKAGGHFLPVSFSASSSLKEILESVTPTAILVSDSVDSDVHMLGDKHKVPFINIRTILNNPIDSHNKSFCEPIINEGDLAYIIKTSGSTGKPKQCKISHKSLGIIANAWKIVYKMDTFEVNLLQWAPLSFGVFIGDLIRGLVSSPGTLTICPDERRLDIPYLIKLIKQQNITIAEMTPQFAVQLVQNSKPGDLDSLNLLIIGSDILSSHVYKKVKEHLNPHQQVINGYGMTEATIDSALFFEGNVIPKTRSNAIPIGKPLPGVTIYILDPKTLLPCPVGTIGEIYISGQVLASGDAEVVHIESINCNCLKTNDAAAWLPSGDIELLGRLNRVTKLRGFRINTTEIENKIVTNVAGVKYACVVVLDNENVNENKFLCAFIVQEANKVVDLVTLRNQLSGKLPYYMLPDIVHTIEKMPLSQNGKVDLKALPSLSDVLEIKNKQEKNTAYTKTELQIHATLKELFSEAMGTEISHIHLDKTFMEQGGHSLVLLHFATLLKEKTAYEIGISDIFSYPSINSLTAYIQKSNYADLNTNNPVDKQLKLECNYDIAITGIGLRLPGDIMSLPQLWQALKEGDDIIRDFPKERINDFLNCLPPSLSSVYINSDMYQGAFLEAIDQFDCQFFKIAPNEANFMPPEQRLFLQVATEALAEGRNLSEVKGTKIGVFVGQCDIKYAELSYPDEAHIAGMTPGMVATRVAYQWDLKGPSVLVDTACSSSLMALKQACESMRNGECEGALVGAINLVLYPARKGVFGKTSILSPDFHCRPFDKDASGIAVGEGVLCIYAQPLHIALKEHKCIYGVIKSVASNNVGHGNGITAPSSVSQQSVIKEALSDANVRSSDISFIECHGTGTILGDRIELSALNSIFNHNLPIGSIKSKFGHLKSAAGLLGLFKILASLMAKKIPPTLHFKVPHPELKNSLIYVPSTTVNWNGNNAGKRIAGLSSFGEMGTNCHAIITEMQTNINEVYAENSSDSTHYPLLLCGKTFKQIQKQVSLHQTHIQELILNANRHTLLKFCITVAKRLKEIKFTGIGHNEYRMIITAQNAEQMMMVMKVIIHAENMESLIPVATLRSDVYFCSPNYKYTDVVYESFLMNGEIDLQLLFPDVTDHDTNLASCVTLALYNESRHWLELSFSQNMIDSDNEDLLSLLNRKANETRELIRMLPLGPTQDLKYTQGRFCCAIIIRLFLSTHLAAYLENGKVITLKEAFQFTGMLQKYDKLFFVMIRELCENDLIQAIGKNESIKNLDSFYFKCKDFLNVDPENIANYAVGKYPLWADCFRFPLYCSKSLLAVLMGKMSPLSVIYPQGDLNFIYQYDKLGDLLGDVYYNMYLQVIAMYAKNLSRRGNKVRILEVGAGVGYVTRQLLPKLKEVPNIEYWFTDLGKTFVDQAKAIFDEYNFMMRFSTFDITKNPIMQGIFGPFDIIISYNVIHTTENIFASVVNLSSCLGEGCTLFIIESAVNKTWATLAWGILDSWWHFKDHELRPTEPMLEPNQWEMILSKVGFASVYSFPTDINEREHVEKFLFICSAKMLHRATSVDQPGWWECITKFQPSAKYSEVSDNKGQINTDKNKDTEISINENMIYKELESIWSELLGVKDIQPDDNFNFLGGNSLLTIQMMHAIRRRIGYQLDIADTFACRTLQALADFIYEKLSEEYLIAKESVKSSISENEVKLHIATKMKSHNGVLMMFPGQGTQKVGMCASMKDNAPAVEIFNRAKQILGYDILEICRNKESLLIEKFKSIEFVQVTLFTSCVAKVEQLKCEKPELIKQVTHVAGQGVGEFVALVYAGVLKFEDALRFIQKRGEAMENDVEIYSTGTVSIFGPTSAQVQEFLDNCFPCMTISAYLGDNQHTVAGTEEECQTFMQMLTERDGYSLKMEVIDVRKLNVVGAFHSFHMEQAATLLDPILDQIAFSKPLLPVIMNVNGQIVDDPMEIKLMSCKQLIAAVKWKQSMVTAYKCGIRDFVEVAPSRVLSSIVKKRISECPDCNVTYINV